MTFSPEIVVEKYIPFFSTSFGVAIFICLYALWVILLLPGSWLTMLAGLIYGSWIGSVVVFAGACIGAQITFALSRTWLKQWSQKKLSAFPKLQSVQMAVAQEGLKLIFLTRLSPVFPFSLLNLVYGISEIRPFDFTIGLLGILPGTILYCSFGALAGEISHFNEVLSGREDLGSFLLSIASLIATLMVVWLVGRAVRDALKKKD